MADHSELARATFTPVERRLWNDPRVRRRLSPIPPCGQGLWLYLLTTPQLGAMPGLIVMGEAAMAEHLEWPLEAFREAFAEVSREGMARADWKARVVVVNKAIRRCKPESPNVIRSWRRQWLDVPECDLKLQYYLLLKTYVEGLQEGFRRAFAEAVPDPSSNQEQEQEQYQEQEQEDGVSRAGACVGGWNGETFEALFRDVTKRPTGDGRDSIEAARMVGEFAALQTPPEEAPVFARRVIEAFVAVLADAQRRGKHHGEPTVYEFIRPIGETQTTGLAKALGWLEGRRSAANGSSSRGGAGGGTAVTTGERRF